ncbi:polyprenyl synthetase family protein [Isoalcanivorax indicus]|uniref:polyprenyl synthetase family protein n=1 Tax=Isoalcanivorax indicus TaxID=2202653 RepID=UPI000DB9EFAC|nr:polyprenyl synthetase family protein [Isoalcanivorax indicus]
MDFKAISAVVADDFDAVNRFITHHLDSNVPMIREVGEYIVGNGGKRLRPLVAILSARASGYTGERHIDIAAVIEFLHTATLLHDDVVDESNMRRGRPTVNAVWGNAASVLVGDFLISRAFELLVQIGNQTLLEILSASTNVISEGEVLQLINCRDPDTTEERYMRVIHHKTAKMFESAAQTGAVLATDNAADAQRAQEIFGAYGRHMGIAFQLIDDVLDYTGNAAELGKNVGDDLAEGKPTLPLIYTMREGTPEQAALIRQAIRTGGLGQLDEIIETVQVAGGLEYTRDLARQHTQSALASLAAVPDSRYKEALERLASEAAERRF